MSAGARVASEADWQAEFERWLAPFVAALGDRRRGRWAPVYLRGLLAPGERKSIAPLAARVAPADYQQLHHFVCGACWDPAPLEVALAREATRLVGGPDAVLIVDDTALPKQGTHSVGVGRQYAGVVGTTRNCQVLVSVTLARAEVPIPVALRLFLPEAWTADPARCARAGVPEARRTFQSKPALALAELDRLRALGVPFGRVLADAGYGMSVAFRQGLSARGLLWAVGLLPQQLVYPPTVHLAWPVRRPGQPGPHARQRRPVPAAVHAEAYLAGARWRRLTWRDGTKGPLTARFAAARVRIADGPLIAAGLHLPGAEELWLVGEERANGERKYYASNLPATASLTELARTIKARWACEQAHQQLKAELGLDHFEGRSWVGLHHHALLTQLAFTFLQHLRLRAAAASDASEPRADRPALRARSARGKNRPPAGPPAPRPAARALAPHDPPAPRPTPARRAPALPNVPRSPHL